MKPIQFEVTEQWKLYVPSINTCNDSTVSQPLEYSLLVELIPLSTEIVKSVSVPLMSS